MSNHLQRLINLGKAGERRRRGWRPSVRGIAMNPVDHPHGGRGNGGRPSCTPWGVYTKVRWQGRGQDGDVWVVEVEGRRWVVEVEGRRGIGAWPGAAACCEGWGTRKARGGRVRRQGTTDMLVPAREGGGWGYAQRGGVRGSGKGGGTRGLEQGSGREVIVTRALGGLWCAMRNGALPRGVARTLVSATSRILTQMVAAWDVSEKLCCTAATLRDCRTRPYGQLMASPAGALGYESHTLILCVGPCVHAQGKRTRRRNKSTNKFILTRAGGQPIEAFVQAKKWRARAKAAKSAVGRGGAAAAKAGAGGDKKAGAAKR